MSTPARKKPAGTKKSAPSENQRHADAIARYADRNAAHRLVHPDHYYVIGNTGYEHLLTALKISCAARDRESFVEGFACNHNNRKLGILPYEKELPGGAPVELFIYELIEAYRTDGPNSPQLTPKAIVEKATRLEKEFEIAFKHARSWLKRYPREVLVEALAPEKEL